MKFRPGERKDEYATFFKVFSRSGIDSDQEPTLMAVCDNHYARRDLGFCRLPLNTDKNNGFSFPTANRFKHKFWHKSNKSTKPSAFQFPCQTVKKKSSWSKHEEIRLNSWLHWGHLKQTESMRWNFEARDSGNRDWRRHAQRGSRTLWGDIGEYKGFAGSGH
jgi:hypothetical protein